MAEAELQALAKPVSPAYAKSLEDLRWGERLVLDHKGRVRTRGYMVRRGLALGALAGSGFALLAGFAGRLVQTRHM